MKYLVWLAALIFVVSMLAMSSCASKNPYYIRARIHHTETGFRNNFAQRPGGSFWKWKWSQWTEGIPKPPADGYRFPVHKPDRAYLAANRSEPTLTWLGHATLLLQIGGVNVLTDPHLSARASPLAFVGPSRVVPPPLSVEELPHIDLVVLSHNHYDHLDAATVVRLNRQAGGPPAFYVPLGMKSWMQGRGIDNVVEMDWWEERTALGLTVNFTPMQHWSKRTLWDTNQALWGGWLIRHPQLNFLFLADTGYSADFQSIYARYGAVDLAAIPVGHYEPRWFMKTQHVNPAEAVQIHLDLRARHSVGIHWGTFEGLTDELLTDPPVALAAALKAANLSANDIFLMEHGETRKLAPRRELTQD